jgi:hypothetical protein
MPERKQDSSRARISPFDQLLNTTIRRRGFIQGAGVGTAGVIGFIGGIKAEQQQENRLEVTDDPIEIQIHRVELRNGQEGLRDKALRDHYTWLVAQWYGLNHSFGAFVDPQNEYAAAESIYNSITFIEDPDDPSRREGLDGWAYPGDEIFIDLTSDEFQSGYTQRIHSEGPNLW